MRVCPAPSSETSPGVVTVPKSGGFARSIGQRYRSGGGGRVRLRCCTRRMQGRMSGRPVAAPAASMCMQCWLAPAGALVTCAPAPALP